LANGAPSPLVTANAFELKQAFFAASIAKFHEVHTFNHDVSPTLKPGDGEHQPAASDQ